MVPALLVKEIVACVTLDVADRGASTLSCPCGGAALLTATREPSRALSLSEFCHFFQSPVCCPWKSG